MRRWLDNLTYRMQVFMQGRYGRDELSLVLTVASVVLLLIGLIFRLGFFLYIVLAILIWSLFRTYSKNHAARIKELNVYLKIKNFFINKYKLIRGMWRDRNTHTYLKCPNCKTMIRISKPPKGKKIMITCPKCKNQFEKRT